MSIVVIIIIECRPDLFMIVLFSAFSYFHSQMVFTIKLSMFYLSRFSNRSYKWPLVDDDWRQQISSFKKQTCITFYKNKSCKYSSNSSSRDFSSVVCWFSRQISALPLGNSSLLLSAAGVSSDLALLSSSSLESDSSAPSFLDELDRLLLFLVFFAFFTFLWVTSFLFWW